MSGESVAYYAVDNMEKIYIKLPKGFTNMSVNLDGTFSADTNDSANWDKLVFPLPSGKWVIYSEHNNVVCLRRQEVEDVS